LSRIDSMRKRKQENAGLAACSFQGTGIVGGVAARAPIEAYPQQTSLHPVETCPLYAGAACAVVEDRADEERRRSRHYRRFCRLLRVRRRSGRQG
ncbi:MAG TPA: hypothetical protein VF798_02220, partial [Burkholderiaceae bacterium]